MLPSLSAASVSVPEAPPPVHEHREGASEGEQAAQETPEEDGQVTAVFSPASLPLIGLISAQSLSVENQTISLCSSDRRLYQF